MDVTHCNIGPPKGKFWMLPIITSAHESVKGVAYELNLKEFDVFDVTGHQNDEFDVTANIQCNVFCQFH